MRASNNEMEGIATAFCESWIRAHATPDHALTCSFESNRASYEEEAILQTIFISEDNGNFVLVDEWGGDISFGSWANVLEFLRDSGAERLMEMRITDGVFVARDGMQ